MAKDYVTDHVDFVDDFYFSALLDEEMEDDVFPADAKYAEVLQFQEALLGSIIISQMNKNDPSPPLSKKARLLPYSEDHMVMEEAGGDYGGQSSLSYCEICLERKENDEMFRSSSCVHSFCVECMSKHVALKIHDNISVISCPGLYCTVLLDVETCRPMLPKGVMDLWEETLREKLIDASQRFHCPYKDCSAMMTNDSIGEAKEEIIREAECPFCHRPFCARCCVPWHAGVDCEDYQRLNEDEREREDLLVVQLARDKKWSRCPSCRFYVERTEGCSHMTCRCNFQFCYGCGSEWSQMHAGCASD